LIATLRTKDEERDGNQHQREPKGLVTEMGCLSQQRQRDDRARKDSDKDRGPTEHLLIAECSGRQETPVFGGQDLQGSRIV